MQAIKYDAAYCDYKAVQLEASAGGDSSWYPRFAGFWEALRVPATVVEYEAARRAALTALQQRMSALSMNARPVTT